MKNSTTLYCGEPADAQALREIKPPHRILVLDDDSVIREISAKALTRSGYEVDAADDGAAGWEALHAKSYDLLITDNNMPKITGLELVRKLRSARMTVPVILASGVLPAEKPNEYPKLQLSATLQKPFTVDELVGTVERILGATDLQLTGNYSDPLSGGVQKMIDRGVPQ